MPITQWSNVKPFASKGVIGYFTAMTNMLAIIPPMRDLQIA